MTKSRLLSICALTFLLVLMVGPIAWAQEGTTAPSKTLWDIVKTSGWVGVLIIMTSVAGTAFLIENLVNIKEAKLAPPELIGEIEGLLDEGRLDEALQVCDSDRTYLSSLVAGGLLMGGGSLDDMVKGLESASVEENFKLQAKVSYLSLVGNICPLLGLLGTVTGMIGAFQTIEKKKAPTPADLAVGVYESLVTTVLGLLSGISFLIAFFMVKNHMMRLTLGISGVAMELIRKAHTSQQSR